MTIFSFINSWLNWNRKRETLSVSHYKESLHPQHSCVFFHAYIYIPDVAAACEYERLIHIRIFYYSHIIRILSTMAVTARERYLSILSSGLFLFFFDGASRCTVADRRGEARDPGLSRVTGTTNGPRVRASLTARPWHPSDCVRPLRVDHVISRKWKRTACAEPIQARDRIACNLSPCRIPRVWSPSRHQLSDICMSTRRSWNCVSSGSQYMPAWIVGGDMNERVYLACLRSYRCNLLVHCIFVPLSPFNFLNAVYTHICAYIIPILLTHLLLFITIIIIYVFLLGLYK